MWSNKCWAMMQIFHCVVSDNIPTPPAEVFLVFVSTPYPSGNSSLGSYIPLKFWPLRPPSPSEFPMTLCGGGMDIFQNHTFYFPFSTMLHFPFRAAGSYVSSSLPIFFHVFQHDMLYMYVQHHSLHSTSL